MGKRITDLRVFFISLCPRGANKIKAILRDDDAFVFEGIAKADADGKLHAIVYAPGLLDSQGHRVDDAQVIEKACHGYITNAIKQGGGIDLRHNFQPLDPAKARLCESFLIQKGDPRFADATYDGKPFDPTGGWGVVIELIDPDLRKLYATGEWAGVSLGGLARIEPVQKEGMDEKAMKAAIAAAIAEALPAALASVTKQQATQDTPAKTEPVRVEFEGDPANPEDLAAHSRKLALAQFDLSTPKGFADYQAFLAKEQRQAKPAPRPRGTDEPVFLSDEGELSDVLKANDKFMKERYAHGR